MTEMTQPPASAAARLMPLAVIGVVALAGAFLLRDVLSYDALAAHREALAAFRDAHYLPAALVFVAAYVTIVAFSLPGATVATLTGGFLFGTFPGVFYNVVAATLGAMAIFAAARWGLGERLAARMDAADGQVKRIKDGIDTNQWEMLFLMRLVPIVPFFVANLVPALVGVRLPRFAISTFLGIIPGALVYTSVGAGLGEVLEAGKRPNLGVIFEPQIVLPLMGLCVLAALPMIVRAVRGNGDR